MSKKLTVAHIIPELDINIMGGVGRFLQNLVRCLPHNSVETIILSYKAQESDKKFFQDLGITVFSRLPHNHEEDGNSLEVTQWMINTLKEIKPDIVQTNAFWGDTLGRLAAQKAGVPIIVTRENNVNIEETKRQKRMKHRLAGFTDSVICISEAVRKYSLFVEKIPAECMEVIYNGLVLKDYKFDYSYDKTKTLNFVFVGRLETQKVPLRLIEAFAKVIAENYDCRLLVIGDGSLKKECYHRVAKLGLSEKVEFLGYQENPWSIVPKDSIFVLSSDYEGFGTVVIEAMASGSLCILPTIEAVEEIAHPNSEAIFYQLGNSKQLVASMKLVLEMSLAQRIQIIKAARARVERDFDAHIMANNYLKLYQNLYKNKTLALH